MEKRSGYESFDEDGELDRSEAKEVFLNVISTLGILLFTAMVIVGVVFFKDCPTQPNLPVYLIVQGLMSVSMPVLFLLKYRLNMAMKRIHFLTFVITVGILSLAWFGAGSYWLFTSGCPETILFRTTIGFLVPLWMLGISFLVVIIWACCKK